MRDTLKEMNPFLTDLAFIPAPPQSIDKEELQRLCAENARPKDWKRQFAILCFGENTKGLGALEEYIGDTSTYSLKTALEEQLFILYLRFHGDLNNQLGALSNEERKVIVAKLTEQAGSCAPGFHARINEILESVLTSEPNSVGQLIHVVRAGLVSDAAAAFANTLANTKRFSAGFEVHLAAEVVNYAGHEKSLGVAPRFEEDVYAVSFKDNPDIMKDALIAKFQEKFTPYRLPILIGDQLRTRFASWGYTGKRSSLTDAEFLEYGTLSAKLPYKKDSETGTVVQSSRRRTDKEEKVYSALYNKVYSLETQQKIGTFLEKILENKTDAVESGSYRRYMKYDENACAFDINWGYIYQRLFQRLNEEKFLDVAKSPEPSEWLDFAIQSDTDKKKFIFPSSEMIKKLFSQPIKAFKELDAIFSFFPTYYEQLLKQPQFQEQFVAAVCHQTEGRTNLHGIMQYAPKQLSEVIDLAKTNDTVLAVFTDVLTAKNYTGRSTGFGLLLIAQHAPELLSGVIALGNKHTGIDDAFLSIAHTLQEEDRLSRTGLYRMASDKNKHNQLSGIIKLAKVHDTVGIAFAYALKKQLNCSSGLHTIVIHAPAQLPSVIELAKINDAVRAAFVHALIAPYYYQNNNYDYVQDNRWIGLGAIMYYQPTQLSYVIELAKTNDAVRAALCSLLKTTFGNDSRSTNTTGLVKIARYAPEQLSDVIELAKTHDDVRAAFICALQTKFNDGTGLQMIARYAPEQLSNIIPIIHDDFACLSLCLKYMTAPKNNISNTQKRYEKILELVSHQSGSELRKKYNEDQQSGAFVKTLLSFKKDADVFATLKENAMSDPDGASNRVLSAVLADTIKTVAGKFTVEIDVLITAAIIAAAASKPPVSPSTLFGGLFSKKSISSPLPPPSSQPTISKKSP